MTQSAQEFGAPNLPGYVGHIMRHVRPSDHWIQPDLGKCRSVCIARHSHYNWQIASGIADDMPPTQ